jgi:hypothetical protein
MNNLPKFPPYHPDINDLRAMNMYYLGRRYFEASMADDKEWLDKIQKFMRDKREGGAQ